MDEDELHSELFDIESHMDPEYLYSVSTPQAEESLSRPSINRYQELREQEELKRKDSEEEAEQERRKHQRLQHEKYGLALKEGWLDKRSGGRLYSQQMNLISTYKSRFVVLKESCVVYYTSDTSTDPKDCLLFTSQMVIKREGDLEFTIKADARRLGLRGRSRDEVDGWISAIESVLLNSPFAGSNGFSSFAPLRGGGRLNHLVDGQEGFKTISRAIQAAREEVLIASWWLSPHIFVERECWTKSRRMHISCMEDGINQEEEEEEPSSPDPSEGGRWLDLRALLLSVADRGVQIFILHYREVGVALPHNSAFTESTFNSSPNIHFIRHPWQSDLTHQLWSHHEKIVVVDRKIGFIGGLDLTFGRFDTSFHHVFLFYFIHFTLSHSFYLCFIYPKHKN